MYLGAFDMLSIPPATTTSLRPNCMVSAASMVAAMKRTLPIKIHIFKWEYWNTLPNQQQQKKNIPFIPDAQTLLIVVQITDVGIPAPNAACLAGACPKLALRTFPKNTSCTSDGSTFALSRAPAEEQEFA